VAQAILSSKTIIWNGPMGVFEMAKFETGARSSLSLPLSLFLSLSLLSLSHLSLSLSLSLSHLSHIEMIHNGHTDGKRIYYMYVCMYVCMYIYVYVYV
jgi:hypothetical protein